MRTAVYLHRAKAVKNDEFYTKLSDIEKELEHYKSYMVGKTVYCNCDDPERSAFWRYFHEHFVELGLKRLISTHLSDRAYRMEYAGGNDGDISVGVKTYLRGDGDFRSDECIEILKQSDIVVTNPPFSLFREHVALLVLHGKQFLVVGSKNAVTYKDFFPLLKDGRVLMGHNSIHEFVTPDGSVKKFGNIGWYTNMGTAKHCRPVKLTKHYDPVSYPKYDNYDAIEVGRIADIPCDYGGVMGVPITFFDSFNPKQFVVLGYAGGLSWDADNDACGRTTKKYFEVVQHNTDGSTQRENKGKANTRPALWFYGESPLDITYYTVPGRDGYMLATYGRVLIRRNAQPS